MENEYLKVFLDSTKNAMKTIKGVELSDEFVDMLYNKYRDMEKRSINQNEVFDYIHKDIEDHLAGIDVEETFPKAAVKVDESECLKNLEMISTAKTAEELQGVISNIPGMDVALKDLDFETDYFDSVKRGVFELYKDDLVKSGIKVPDNIGNLDTKKEEKEIPQVQESAPISQKSEQNDLNAMMNSEEDTIKEEITKEPEKESGKVLVKASSSEEGFAYSPAINITVLLLLAAFFIIAIFALA